MVMTTKDLNYSTKREKQEVYVSKKKGESGELRAVYEKEEGEREKEAGLGGFLSGWSISQKFFHFLGGCEVILGLARVRSQD